MKAFDVCIVGGGAAGTLLATLARRSGRAAVLVSSDRGKRPASETLSPEAVRILREAGLGECLAACGGTRSSGWNDAWHGLFGPVHRSSICSALGSAWHVDRGAFDSALRAAVCDSGVPVIAANVEAVSRTANGYTVMGPSLSVSCREVVDATGAAARVGQLLDVRRTILDCQFAAYVVLERAMNEPRLDVAGFEDGWVYACPRDEEHTQVAAVTDRDVLRALGSRALMVRALNALGLEATPREILGLQAVCLVSHVTQGPFPAGFSQVGDAAWTPDPLSGHGVARALASALHLVSGNWLTTPPAAEVVLSHLRRRSAFLAATPWPNAPYHRRREMAYQKAEAVLGTPIVTAGPAAAYRQPTRGAAAVARGRGSDLGVSGAEVGHA